MNPSASPQRPTKWSRKPARDGVGLAQVGDGDEVLALEFLDQRMLGIEARGRALERLAAEPETPPERRRPR